MNDRNNVIPLRPATPPTPAAAAASDPRMLPQAWQPPLPAPLLAGVPRGVDWGQGQGQGQSLATGVVQPIEAPAIEAFPTDGFYPSILFVGPSGHGKSEAVGALADVALNILVVLAEPKGATYVRRRPDIVQIARHEWDYAARYDRIMRFADELGTGDKYRVSPVNGKPYDAIFLDGLTEISDYVEAKFAGLEAAGRSKGGGGAIFDYYRLIGRKLVGVFRTIRDAAGIASSKAGVPPIVVGATCIERLGKLGGGDNNPLAESRLVWQPLLAGQIAGTNIERHFETIWNVETGFNEQGQHEFRVWTQARPGRMGKSPPLFNVCERGAGAWVNPGTRRVEGWPHAGVMFARLLADPRSPYYRDDAAKRCAWLWSA